MPFAAGYARRVHPIRPVRCLASTLIRTAGAPACLILVAATGCSSQTPVEGAVAGLPVGTTPQQITIDLHGHAEAVNRSSVAGTRRIVVSPDGRWNAVRRLPGQAGEHRRGRARAAPLGQKPTSHRRAVTSSTGPASRGAGHPDSRWLAMTVWRPGLDLRRCGERLGWPPRAGRTILFRRRRARTDSRGLRAAIASRSRCQRRGQAAHEARSCSCDRYQVRTCHRTGHLRRTRRSADGRWIATSGLSSELDAQRWDEPTRARGGAAVWGPQGDRIAIVSNGTLLMGTPTKLHRVAAGLGRGATSGVQHRRATSLLPPGSDRRAPHREPHRPAARAGRERPDHAPHLDGTRPRASHRRRIHPGRLTPSGGPADREERRWPFSPRRARSGARSWPHDR